MYILKPLKMAFDKKLWAGSIVLQQIRELFRFQ